jgi:tetratricopeptide (TPR) repeat protein
MAGIRPHHLRWIPLPAIALVALPILLYLPSLGYGLLGYDDARYYLVNRALRGAGGLVALFTRPFYSDYMPVTQLTWWLDLAAFGDRSFAGARVQGLLWFGAGALAVRALVARVSGRRGLAFAVALLYALHPVASHSILWLAERKNLVALALALWAVERYVASREAAEPRRRPARGAAAWALATLALLAKPHAVAVPGMLLAWELCLGRGGPRARAFALAPITLTTGLFVLVSLGWLRADLAQEPLGGSRGAALLASAPIVLRYALHTVAPFDLSLEPSPSFFYAVNEDPGAWGWAAGILLVALCAGALRPGGAAALRWGWLFGLAALLPALNLVAQPQPMADQYHLWALPGWLLALALLAERALGSLRARAGLLACAALLLAFLSWRRTPEYASAEVLFEATARREPQSSLAWAEIARTALRSDEPRARLRAGPAALAALAQGDAHRILPMDRPVLAREAALELYRAGEGARAKALLEAELARLPPEAAPLGAIERADFEIRTGRPELAVGLLAPAFESVPPSVVATLRGRCRSGRVLPHELEPLLGIGLSGDDADRAFNREAILRRLQLLAAAQRALGRPEEAFDVAAFLVNVAPDFRPGREVLRGVYADLGVRLAEGAL